jgi:hypothetical protein
LAGLSSLQQKDSPQAKMTETHELQLAKLRKDFGEVFLNALAHPDTLEILLNA